MSSLQDVFEERYNGRGKYSQSSPRKRLVSILESELPGDDFLSEGDGSNRLRLRNRDFYRLYVAVMRLQGKSPEFLWNGNDLISRSEFERLDEDDDVDSDSLRELWNCLGSD